LNAQKLRLAPGEFLQEFVVGRKDDRGRRTRILLVTDERRPIGLHGAIKGIELRVLAEAFGIDPRRLRLGFGANDLRPLGAFANPEDLAFARVLDAALQAVKAERGRRWVQENRAAFEAANRAIDKYGIFNAEDREW